MNHAVTAVVVRDHVYRRRHFEAYRDSRGDKVLREYVEGHLPLDKWMIGLVERGKIKEAYERVRWKPTIPRSLPMRKIYEMSRRREDEMRFVLRSFPLTLKSKRSQVTFHSGVRVSTVVMTIYINGSSVGYFYACERGLFRQVRRQWFAGILYEWFGRSYSHDGLWYVAGPNHPVNVAKWKEPLLRGSTFCWEGTDVQV